MALFSLLYLKIREIYNLYYEKEVAEVSPGWEPQQLRCCHIRNKTERLSGRKWTAQDYTFSFFVCLTGNHQLESRGKHFKNIRVKIILYYEENRHSKGQWSLRIKASLDSNREGDNSEVLKKLCTRLDRKMNYIERYTMSLREISASFEWNWCILSILFFFFWNEHVDAIPYAFWAGE